MISAMVLAAGQSRRMGTQKLLLPLRGQPMIARVVDELLRSCVDQVVVVVGKESQPIQDAVADRKVFVATTSHAEEEMIYSVRTGLTAMPDETKAAIVALGDQPGITSAVVAKLVQSYRTTHRSIIVPTHNGRRGHPLLFSLRYRDEILTQFAGCGLRGLLTAHPEDVEELEVGSPSVLEDIDLPEDYQRALERLSDGCE